jgi:hypothetical protein
MTTLSSSSKDEGGETGRAVYGNVAGRVTRAFLRVGNIVWACDIEIDKNILIKRDAQCRNRYDRKTHHRLNDRHGVT